MAQQYRNTSDYYIRLGMITDPQYRQLMEDLYPADSPIRQPFTAEEIATATSRSVEVVEAELAEQTAQPQTADQMKPAPQPQDIIKTLQEVRIAQHMSQAAVAKKAGMPQSSLARIEEGKVSPGLQTLQRLAKALGLQLTLQRRPL